jgi:response regulator of citrate/malate metabolism
VLAQQVIQSHLQKSDRFELVGVCNNAMEARELLNKHEVDLMFLDIQLPGMTGLHFLRSLTNRHSLCLQQPMQNMHWRVMNSMLLIIC